MAESPRPAESPQGGESPLKQCVILTGGFGSRLGSWTQSTPKPLLEVGGRPFVEWVVVEAARHRFERILLIAGHMGDQLAERYDGRLFLGARVSVLVEAEPQGTGGALRAALPNLEEAFLTCNGDSLFLFNMLDLLWPKPPDGAWARVALRPMLDVARYGAVAVDGERILSFSEKMAAGPGLINGGVYLLTRAAVALLPANGSSSLESQLFPLLAEQGLLFGRAYEGYFIDIGIPARLDLARAHLADRMCRPAAFLAGPAVSTDSVSAVRWLNDAGYYVIVLEDPTTMASQAATRQRHLQDTLRSGGAHVDVFSHSPDWLSPESQTGPLDPRAALRDLMTRIPVELPARGAGSFLVAASPAQLRLALESGISAFGVGPHLTAGALQAELAKQPG
jgi:NDP-sugar pyrophosphorylase family protein